MERPNLLIASSAHGMSIAHELYRAVEVAIDVKISVWTDLMVPDGEYLDFLRSTLQRSDAVLYVITTEDITPPKQGEPATANNLLFEIGLSIGILGTEKTFVVTDAPRILPFELDGARVFKVQPEFKNLDNLIQPVCATLRSAQKRDQGMLGEEPKYDCFISHDDNEKMLARRLRRSLLDIGIQAWTVDRAPTLFGPMPLKGPHDKLISIVSKETLATERFKRELEVYLEAEVEQKRFVFFPIVTDISLEIPVLAQLGVLDPPTSRPIIVFEQWSNPERYHRSFIALVRSLTAATASERMR